MSNFRTIDRQTGFLLPPCVDEWLPERHLARFMVEVIDGLDLRAMSASYRGSGSASYHPAMLLGILVYGYATGVFSSRKLERATYDSVAFRFIAANDHPDHDTIATFRHRFLEEIEALFVQVLILAREAGLLKLGTVTLTLTSAGSSTLTCTPSTAKAAVAGVAAYAVLHQESLQRLAPAGGKQDHALVNAVEHRVAQLRHALVTPAALFLFDFVERVEGARLDEGLDDDADGGRAEVGAPPAAVRRGESRARLAGRMIARRGKSLGTVPADPGQHPDHGSSRAAARIRHPTIRTRVPSSTGVRATTATASAWAQVFSLPRSRAPITTPRSTAARRRPEIATSRATISASVANPKTITPPNIQCPTRRVTGSTPSSICHAMKFGMSRSRSRW